MSLPFRKAVLFGLTSLSITTLASPALAASQAEQVTQDAVESDGIADDQAANSLPEQPTPPATASDAAAATQIVPVSPVFADRKRPMPNFLIAGFAEGGLAISDKEAGSGSTYFSGSFNPGLYFQYDNLLLFESELEITINEDGDTETALEFAQLDLLLHNNVTLVVGKFLSPVGQYQERLHPAWINRLPSAPPGFGHDGLQPGADVGVQLRGGVPFGRSRFTYALAVGNGPRLMEDGALEQEGFSNDDNRNKAISGRLGFLPLPFIEVGVSFLTAKVRGTALEAHGEEELASAAEEAEEEAMIEGPNTRLKIWGFDAAYRRGGLDIRGEFLRGTRDSYELIPEMEDEEMLMVPKLKLKAWYAQAAYRLSAVTQNRILQNFEPVIRYGEYRIKGAEELAEEAAEKRLSVGLNYWFAPSIVLHGAVERRRFTAREPGERGDTRFLLQLAYGF